MEDKDTPPKVSTEQSIRDYFSGDHVGEDNIFLKNDIPTTEKKPNDSK